MAPCTHTYIHMHTGSPTESHSDLCNRPPRSLHPGADHSAQYSRKVGEAGRDLLVYLSAPLHYRPSSRKMWGLCFALATRQEDLFTPQMFIGLPTAQCQEATAVQVGPGGKAPSVPRGPQGDEGRRRRGGATGRGARLPPRKTQRGGSQDAPGASGRERSVCSPSPVPG